MNESWGLQKHRDSCNSGENNRVDPAKADSQDLAIDWDFGEKEPVGENV